MTYESGTPSSHGLMLALAASQINQTKSNFIRKDRSEPVHDRISLRPLSYESQSYL